MKCVLVCSRLIWFFVIIWLLTSFCFQGSEVLILNSWAGIQREGEAGQRFYSGPHSFIHSLWFPPKVTTRAQKRPKECPASGTTPLHQHTSTLSHTHIHSLSHTHTLSHTHIHSLSHTHPLSHTHTHTFRHIWLWSHFTLMLKIKKIVSRINGSSIMKGFKEDYINMLTNALYLGI